MILIAKLIFVDKIAADSKLANLTKISSRKLACPFIRAKFSFKWNCIINERFSVVSFSTISTQFPVLSKYCQNTKYETESKYLRNNLSSFNEHLMVG